MGEPAIDPEARERVTAVETRLVAHEKHCGERWDTTTKAIDSLEQRVAALDAKLSISISKVHDKVDSFRSVLTKNTILVLLGVAAFALVQWFMWAKVALPGAG